MSKLIFKTGNIFDSTCEALVCPVNCYGIMGAGLAKTFRDKIEFDKQNRVYKEACMQGLMAPGSVIAGLHGPISTKVAFYLATKMDWRDDSKLEWVEHGLINLVKAMYHYNIKSIALPALGTGKGHLPWPSVELIIKTIFENDGQSRVVEVYEPVES